MAGCDEGDHRLLNSSYVDIVDSMEGQPRRDRPEPAGPLYRTLRRIEEQCADVVQLSMSVQQRAALLEPPSAAIAPHRPANRGSHAVSEVETSDA
jgi:hypothetical protein